MRFLFAESRRIRQSFGSDICACLQDMIRSWHVKQSFGGLLYVSTNLYFINSEMVIFLFNFHYYLTNFSVLLVLLDFLYYKFCRCYANCH